ncbi:MAG: formate--tetrahydrofolate ligase, partial [Planctomycetes bacterium]|nr:formate--tetrahydrofolate ligase [Planctomycetota bacterium]
MPTDLEIARGATLRPIDEVARDLGLSPDNWRPFGRYIAKIDPRVLASPRIREKPSRLVLVSAITPTPAGEGKTTTSIGLAQGLARLGQSVCLALREPSLGPAFGMKGGATGGGRSQI